MISFVSWRSLVRLWDELYGIQDALGGVTLVVTRLKSLILGAFCQTFSYSDYQASQASLVTQDLIITFLFVVVIMLVSLMIAMYGSIMRLFVISN